MIVGGLWQRARFIGFGVTLFLANNANAGHLRGIYDFSGGSDGATPVAGLIATGAGFYGTTEAGGGNTVNCPGNPGGPSGCGTVFKVIRKGAESVLYAFQGGADGAFPAAGLLNIGGTFYGTTAGGGGSTNCPGGCGTVFSITEAGVKHTLYAFQGNADGATPYAGLIAVGGVLYGTTLLGGSAANCPNVYGLGSGCGTVFSVTTNGQKSLIYTFKGAADGANPSASLLDWNGVLYGTTQNGGGTACFGAGCGTVFSVTPAGLETVMHAFQGGSDGAAPLAGLTQFDGRLYGTTSGGGTNHYGTVFSITRGGFEKVRSPFSRPLPGITPEANLTVAGNTLFGSTEGGGSKHCVGELEAPCGTIFSIEPHGPAKTVIEFSGGADGGMPLAGLLADKNQLFGTASAGGNTQNCQRGCGTLFSLKP